MKTIICDLDDTLCYPSPYQKLLSIEKIEDQHTLATTRKFKQSLLKAPLAPWVSQFPEILNGTIWIVTGRWTYQQRETIYWLYYHNIHVFQISFLNFESWDLYFTKKTNLINRIITRTKNHVVIDDNEDIIKWARFEGLKTIFIKNGLMVGEYDG